MFQHKIPSSIKCFLNLLQTHKCFNKITINWWMFANHSITKLSPKRASLKHRTPATKEQKKNWKPTKIWKLFCIVLKENRHYMQICQKPIIALTIRHNSKHLRICLEFISTYADFVAINMHTYIIYSRKSHYLP